MFNQITLLGRITKDPVIVTVKDTKVARITVATDVSYKKIKRTEFTECIAFGTRAGVLEKFVKKGEMINIVGQLETNIWEHEGQKYYRKFVRITNITLLPNGKKEKVEATPTPTVSQ